MSNVDFQKGMKIDDQAVALAEFFRRKTLGDYVGAMIQQFGIASVKDSIGTPGDAFKVRANGATFTVDPGKAILKDLDTGMPVTVYNAVQLTPHENVETAYPQNGHLNSTYKWPGADGTYYVLLRYTRSRRFPLSFQCTTGGATPRLTVTPSGGGNPGHNDLRLTYNGGDVNLADWLRVGSRILISSSDARSSSNQGLFTVTNVNAAGGYIDLDSTYERWSDGAVTATNMTATTSSEFIYIEPGSWFFSGYPTGSPSVQYKQISWIDHWQIEIRSALPTLADDFVYLAKVVWSGSGTVVTVTEDHRADGLLYFLPAVFRQMKPAMPDNLRWQWGLMERKPSSAAGQDGALIRRVDMVDFDEVHDFTPSRCWVRVKWGWIGNGYWGTGLSAGKFVVTDLRPAAVGAASMEEPYSFDNNELIAGGLAGTYYLYVNDVRYEITANTVSTYPAYPTITTENGLDGGGVTTPVPFMITPDGLAYELEWLPLSGTGNPADPVQELARRERADQASSPIVMEHVFMEVPMGMGFRVRVRTSRGTSLAEKSGWAQTSGYAADNLPANTWSDGKTGNDILILPEPPVMSNCLFDSVDGGVTIQYSRSPGAAAYFCSYTLDAATPSPPPGSQLLSDDPSSLSQVYLLGPNSSLSFRIPAQPGQLVRARLWCVDQFGQRSSNTIVNTAGIVAGGVTVGRNEKVQQLQNRSMSTAARTREASVLGYIYFPQSFLLTQLAANFATITNGTTTGQTWISVYMEGQPQEAITLSVATAGRSIINSVQEFTGGGWLVVEAYNATDGSGQCLFTATDVYIAYRENDIRQSQVVNPSTGTPS